MKFIRWRIEKPQRLIVDVALGTASKKIPKNVTVEDVILNQKLPQRFVHISRIRKFIPLIGSIPVSRLNFQDVDGAFKRLSNTHTEKTATSMRSALVKVIRIVFLEESAWPSSTLVTNHQEPPITNLAVHTASIDDLRGLLVGAGDNRFPVLRADLFSAIKNAKPQEMPIIKINKELAENRKEIKTLFRIMTRFMNEQKLPWVVNYNALEKVFFVARKSDIEKLRGVQS